MALKPYRIGKMYEGVNNRLDNTQLTRDTQTSGRLQQLEGADNVDLNDAGRVKRRPGQTLAVTGRTHSLWADGPDAFAVLLGNLQRLSDGGASLLRTTIRPGMPDLYVSYSRGANGHVYWTNGLELRRIVGNADRAASAAPLQRVPVISLAPGALAPGLYLVAITRADIDGESPAATVQVQVPANGGLTFTASEPVRVYMSGPDGSILTHQATGTTVTIVTHNENGPRCETLNRAPMPAGTIVRHFNGRMLVARDNILFISDPYNYGLYDPARSFIPLPSPINMLEPTAGGVYIGADKVYWLTDFTAAPLADVTPYPALPRSSGVSPDKQEVFWLSEHGVVIGDATGTAKLPQDDRLAFGGATSGATLYRKQDGMTQIVGTRANAAVSVARVNTFMDADILRKGTIV